MLIIIVSITLTVIVQNDNLSISRQIQRIFKSWKPEIGSQTNLKALSPFRRIIRVKKKIDGDVLRLRGKDILLSVSIIPSFQSVVKTSQ